ncbi:MAG: ribose 5-phosphate isomerase B [Aquificota bacterium]|uniref:Ribose 5-phosphate isomerase B n=1 Tax=Thermosulfidibacter takaii TaxID=412593 RepID=A0A7C0Y8H9_9BACT|nr:MAG: ribose 5-phosphate isomerase B [Aquificota bacterium]RLD98404.1 MAG: ribose 5-phosphate isomerase B [Aquificota bacterium]HDD53445.1 ribose 5-phosphate isomerase B [Thermosulfidibacter takaii]
MRLALASDHGGFELKEAVRGWLQEWGYQVVDLGTHSPESVDYPDYIALAAAAVSRGETDRAVVLCGTGIGASIVANKFPGVRATLCHDIYTARMSRLHNDSNVLAMGGRILGADLAREMLKVWLETPFEGGRHERRLRKVAEIERKILEGEKP